MLFSGYPRYHKFLKTVTTFQHIPAYSGNFHDQRNIQNTFSFIISLIFHVEPWKKDSLESLSTIQYSEIPPSWISPHHVTQTLQFDWSKPIFLHNLINIPCRALQKGSWTILYSKMSAMLDFAKPRDLNNALICYHPYFTCSESLLVHSTLTPSYSSIILHVLLYILQWLRATLQWFYMYSFTFYSDSESLLK